MALSVLIVAPNPGRSAILEQALGEAGYQVVARLDSEHGLVEQVGRLGPDVILIDLDVPGRDTLEQMRKLSRTNPNPSSCLPMPKTGSSSPRQCKLE